MDLLELFCDFAHNSGHLTPTTLNCGATQYLVSIGVLEELRAKFRQLCHHTSEAGSVAVHQRLVWRIHA